MSGRYIFLVRDVTAESNESMPAFSGGLLPTATFILTVNSATPVQPKPPVKPKAK